MPRYLLRPKRVREAPNGIRVRGYKGFIDPFGAKQGTEPERVVYYELSKRNIPFYFQTEVDFNLPEIGVFKKYRPDFVLFNDKTIIEVQGSYWHSRKEAQEADAYKFAVYATLGYKVLIWWDYDIMSRVDWLFSKENVFDKYTVGALRKSEVVTSRKRTIDDSKGIKTLNYERGARQRYKKKAIGISNAKRRITKSKRSTLTV